MVICLKGTKNRGTKGKLEERIVVDPEIRHGKPTIKGTRVPVEVVLGSLAGGMDIENICEEYDLNKEDIYAAIDYARRRISGEEVSSLEV